MELPDTNTSRKVSSQTVGRLKEIPDSSLSGSATYSKCMTFERIEPKKG
jgi:hypothetical protein